MVMYKFSTLNRVYWRGIPWTDLPKPNAAGLHQPCVERNDHPQAHKKAKRLLGHGISSSIPSRHSYWLGTAH